MESGFLYNVSGSKILSLIQNYYRFLSLERAQWTGTGKGPYPLGDTGVIGDRISQRWPILSPIALLVWPFYWATGRPPSPGDWVTTVLYQACLIFHHRLIALRWRSPSDQSLKDRATKWVWPLRETTDTPLSLHCLTGSKSSRPRFIISIHLL